MGALLPDLTGQDGIQSSQITQFRGYNHTLAAGDGELYDMENLTGDHAPVLSSRPRRYVTKTLAKPNGLYCDDRVIYVDGTSLTVDGMTVGTVSDSRKTFCGISGRVVILPDKVLLTADNKIEQLEATYSAAGLRFCDGTYAEVAAKANSIVTTGSPFPFREGDAVTIEGCTVKPANNKTPIIREISADKKTLRFYEYVFDLGDSTSVTEPGTVTLKRTVPDLEFVCCNENRMWGCYGDTICCSKLGDPYNWNVFDGVATDSFSVETGTPGKFTACTSYLGYPIFFKEDRIFKVYGDKPTNFQVMSSATLGVQAGSSRSLAIAGETLYYLSRAGITAYSGGIPQSIAAPFGGVRYRNAVAGSDGSKYVVSMQDMGGAWHVFVYGGGMWHREDSLQLLETAYHMGLYGLGADGRLLLLESPAEIPGGASQEAALQSWVEFGDFTFDSFDSKYPVRLRLRLSMGAGASVAAFIQYNSNGRWTAITTVQTDHKRGFHLTVPVRRCDHFRLKLQADGDWQLWAMAWELYDGRYVREGVKPDGNDG